jgi:phosphoenolpyruvate carboxylase
MSGLPRRANRCSGSFRRWRQRREAPAYESADELQADLAVLTNSLVQNGSADLAQGRLAELREAVQSFGFHLAVMDLRQNSLVHQRTVAELLREASVSDNYADLSEDRAHGASGARAQQSAPVAHALS